VTEPTSSEQPKTDAALEALATAIEKVQAFQEDNDETDAAQIWDRVHELERRLQGAPSHAPKDALTGLPVNPDGGADLGPADPLRTTDPVVTPEEAGQAESQPEGTPNLSDNTGESQRP
jgi:hypothetical protein